MLEQLGLCEKCAHARRIAHPRGEADYWRCDVSERDTRYPRFPRLPVLQCDAYEEGTPNETHSLDAPSA